MSNITKCLTVAGLAMFMLVPAAGAHAQGNLTPELLTDILQAHDVEQDVIDAVIGAIFGNVPPNANVYVADLNNNTWVEDEEKTIRWNPDAYNSDAVQITLCNAERGRCLWLKNDNGSTKLDNDGSVEYAATKYTDRSNQFYVRVREAGNSGSGQ